MVFDESIRAIEQSGEQLKTYDERVEELAQQPQYARKVERYKVLRGVRTITAMTIVTEGADLNRDRRSRFKTIRDSTPVHGIDRTGAQRAQHRRA
jgi:transposase